MVSTHSHSNKVENNNGLKKISETFELKPEDMNWLIDNLPVIVFRKSGKLSWGMDYISRNVERITGYSIADFNNKEISWSDIVFPEEIKIIDTAVNNATKNKSSYQIQYRIKKIR